MGFASSYCIGAPVAGSLSENRLPEFRADITLESGPRSHEGEPTWTIYDPVRHRCLRIGRAEAAMMEHWAAGGPEQISNAATASGVPTRPDDVLAFMNWARNAGILQDFGPGAGKRFSMIAASRKHGPASWALHNYLFLRVRLGNPDRFFAWLLPVFGKLYSMPGILCMLALMLSGLLLAARQMDAFIGGLIDMASPEGAASVALGLTLSKIIHETGHGLMAKRLRLRVPSAGVAFIVLWPVLWVDATEAWRVPDRFSRLLLDAAGVLAECAFAAICTFIWAWTPPGLVHEAALAVAGGAWIATLAVNLNPFMRFDGYYLLSDFLDVANLQDRAFSLGRWRMRGMLLGYDKPVPEYFRPGLHRVLVMWAWGTWAWRAILFWGIAVMVYHLSDTKLFGIFLGGVEIWYFLASPVFRELKEWIRIIREKGMNMRTSLSFICVGAVMIAAFIPMRTHIVVPALMHSSDAHRITVSEPGEIGFGQHMPSNGTRYAAGDTILALISPELKESTAVSSAHLAGLKEALKGQAFDTTRLATLSSSTEELGKAASELEALHVREKELSLKAPFAGVLRDVPEDVFQNSPMKRGEILGTIVSESSPVVEAYVSEDSLHRLHEGQKAVFHAEYGGRIPVVLERVASSSVKTLPSPELSSLAGGHIPSRLSGKNGETVPDQATYRLLLVSDVPPVEGRWRGVVSIDAEAESFAGRVWRWIAGVFVREAGL